MDALLHRSARVGERLIERRESVAVAESSAGGLISASLLAVPGASRFFVGGGVIYTATAREALLGIHEIGALRPASEPYAALLANNVRQRLGTAWGLSETGAAGPTGNRYGDAPGHCCFGVSGPVERTGHVETGAGDRWPNMIRFAVEALATFEAALESGGA